MKARMARVLSTSSPPGRLVQQNILRLMHQGTGNSRLDSLPLRKAFGAAVGDVLHVQEFNQCLDIAFQRFAGLIMQAAIVANVLPRGETRVQAMTIGQRADPPLHLESSRHRIVAIHAGRAEIGPQDRVENAQCGCFARPIRADQSRDAAIGRGKRHAPQRCDWAKRLVKTIDLNHGNCSVALRTRLDCVVGYNAQSRAPGEDESFRRIHESGPAKLTKNGVGWMCFTQSLSSPLTVPLSTKAAAILGIQPREMTVCPCPGATRCKLFESVRAA